MKYKPRATKNTPHILIIQVYECLFIIRDPLLVKNDTILYHDRSADQWPTKNPRSPTIPAISSPLNMNANPMVAHQMKK